MKFSTHCSRIGAFVFALCLVTTYAVTGLSQTATKRPRPKSAPRRGSARRVPTTGSTNIQATSADSNNAAATTSAVASAYSQDKRDLTGDYDARIRFPNEQLSERAKVTIDRNTITIEIDEKGEKRQISGQVTAVASGAHFAVSLRYERPDGGFDSLSLKLTKQGRNLLLTSVKGENKDFEMTLECPKYPGCQESDPCIPTCNPPKREQPDPSAPPPL